MFPVLIDGARPPRADQLPPELRPLVRRQAIALDYQKFDSDVVRLARAIRKALDLAPRGQPAVEPVALDSGLSPTKLSVSVAASTPLEIPKAVETAALSDSVQLPEVHSHKPKPSAILSSIDLEPSNATISGVRVRLSPPLRSRNRTDLSVNGSRRTSRLATGTQQAVSTSSFRSAGR